MLDNCVNILHYYSVHFEMVKVVNFILFFTKIEKNINKLDITRKQLDWGG